MAVRSRSLFGPTPVTALASFQLTKLYTVPANRVAIIRNLRVAVTVGQAGDFAEVDVTGPGSLAPIGVWKGEPTATLDTQTFQVVSALSWSMVEGEEIWGGMFSTDIFPFTAWFWGTGSLLLGDAV